MKCECVDYLAFYMSEIDYIGTRAPPPEIVFDNSLLPTAPYPCDLLRVATPPRTLTLDKYPFPEVEKYEKHKVDQIPVIEPNPKIHLNDTSFQLSNSFIESTPPIGGGGEGLRPAEEVIHLRRQLAKIDRRVMTLELENINRLQKDKFVVGFGIAYFILKFIIWMNRD